MLFQDLEKLIFSLSSSEKKHFTLYSTNINGPKMYLVLFEEILLSKNNPISNWQHNFKNNYPKSSLESTSNYLFKTLTDFLVQSRIEQNSWYQQLHGLMKAQLCFERSIPDRGLKEISNVYKKAKESENLKNIYQAVRMELDTLHNLNFSNIDEQYIIDKQLEAKLLLKSINEIQDHYNLYELLSYRLANNPIIEENTDDLILGELNLTFNNRKNIFETKKIHLLFQAHYFINKGDYQSALLIFSDLVNQFETNPTLWNYPPYDYLSTLDGIINSLRNTLQYEEMLPFLEKIQTLLLDNYPEHFKNIAKATSDIYLMQFHIFNNQLSQAKSLCNKIENIIFADTEKHIEYYYFQALTFYLLEEYQKTKQILNELFIVYPSYISFSIYRNSKLLYIMTILKNQHDQEYIDSEIRAYKRLFQKKGKLLQIEKLIFKIISLKPQLRGNDWKKKTKETYSKQLDKIVSDNKENLLIKNFDFKNWIQSVFS
ncbi:hypothetical protein [Sphingobacterium endophyticum]|uniref:hypothetical protein n=1 Tax=Sphingobacterium endophyticum TaxID=2546448 RepID=UPI0012E25543|nr:hypothetical protein [Sphingobacterium endophyticum]